MRYCSWCWSKGTHNAATCPVRKKYIEENPDSHEAKREARKLNRRKDRKNTPRKCGFCRKPGHNAKTCSLKKTFYRNFQAVNSAFRRKVLEELCVMGLGTGTLVRFSYNHSDEDILAMVKAIRWANIHCGSEGSRYCVGLQRLQPLPESEHSWRRDRRAIGNRHLTPLLTRPMMGEIYQRDDVYQRFIMGGGSEIEIVSPIDISLINPPDDWLSGTLTDYANTNPLKSDGKDKSLSELRYDAHHFAYYAGVLGLQENEKYFKSFF